MHGLVPGGRRVKYAQAPVAEGGAAVVAGPQSGIIGPPVRQHPRHFGDAMLSHRAITDQARNATHNPG
jgi:hypothetical protein